VADHHEIRIQQALQAAAIRRGLPEVPDHKTPLSTLLEAEDGSAEGDLAKIRREVVAQFLGLCFQDGIHPASAMKNLYAIAHALSPETFGHMTCADIAQLFGESKAAHSWRVKQIFSKLPRSRGARPITLGWQKSPAAVEKYRQAARGNTNRRHK
jgi:hypothetical protein